MRAGLLLILLSFGIAFSPTAHAGEHDDDPMWVDEEAPPSEVKLPEKQTSRWSILLPGFVLHGSAPSGGANDNMPRKLDPGGRTVATPGIGVEFKGHGTFEALLAFVKDCYDNPAATFQVGQHFRIGETTDLGYSLGLYVRKTPLSCLTETVTTGGGGSGGGIHLPGGQQAPRTNTLTYTSCAFQDNFPYRYTVTNGSEFIDIIPAPFLHFSTAVYRGPFEVHLKFMGNYYLNEFGLSIPF